MAEWAGRLSWLFFATGSMNFIFLSLFAGLISIINFIVAARRRNLVGSGPFLILTLGVAIWSFGYALELYSTDHFWMIFWDSIQFVGTDLASVGVIFFVLRFRGLGGVNFRKFSIAGYVFPLANFAVVATSAHHDLVRQNIRFVSFLGREFLTYDYGIWMWIDVLYDYCLILSAVFLLVRGFLSANRFYRQQIGFLLLGILVAFAGTVLTVTGNLPLSIPNLDITPVSFSISNTIWMYALFRHRLFDVIPIARDSVFESISEGIVACDTAGRILDSNPAARKLFGREIVPGIQLENEIPELLKGRIIEIRRADGIVSVDVRRSSIRSKSGEKLGTIYSLIDISEEKKTEEELRKARETAEEADRTKGRFLANVSHEIRTPLNAILGVADLIENAESVEDRRKLSEVFRTAGETLLNTMNDILEVSRIEAGQIRIRSGPVDLRKKLNTALELVKSQAEKKTIEIELRCDEALPEFVVLDGERLSQILYNLLNNAVKFTDSGKVTLSAEACGTAPEIIFRITDTGIGMDEEVQKRLFRPFVQADDSTTRRYGGSGLGLAISRLLLEMMGGHIEVVSRIGSGSVFTFILPLVKSAAGKNSSNDAPPKFENGTSVLIAEDAQENQFILERFLANTGLKVDFAGDGLEAVHHFVEKKYSLVILDIQMPNMDGYECLSRIRSLRPAQPVIALTAFAGKEDRMRLQSAGFDDCLFKPVKRQDLLRTISELVN